MVSSDMDEFLPKVRGRAHSAARPPVDQAAWIRRGESSRLERLFALLPVAGAKLIGLQRVEDAQHLARVAADRKIIDADMADDALGIDDEGGAQRDALVLVEDAQRCAQLALDVGEPR